MSSDERVSSRRSNSLQQRTMWTVGDQALNSAQSFGISLIVARESRLAGVGAFAIAFVVYQVLMAVTRPLNSEPFTVGYSAAPLVAARRAASSALGGAAIVGLASAAACAAVGAAVGGQVGSVLLAFALGIPAFCVQDVWRAVFVATGHPARAFANDATVLAALVPACVVAGDVRPHSAAALVLAWVAATAVGAVLGCAQARLLPAVRRGVEWWRATIHIGGRVLGENVVSNFVLAIGLLSVSLAASVSDLGRLRTAQVAIGPASPIVVVVATLIVAEGSRLLARRSRRYPLFVAGAGMSAVGVAAGLAIAWWLAPVSIGVDVLGDNWTAARALVVACGVYVAGVGANTAISAGLRTIGRPAAALRARVLAAPVGLVGGVGGAIAGGPGWAMAGIAVGEWICALLAGRELRTVWQRWNSEPWALTLPTDAGIDPVVLGPR